MISSIEDYKFIQGDDIRRIIIDGGIMPLRENPYVIRGEDITYALEVRARMNAAVVGSATGLKKWFHIDLREPNELFLRSNWTSLILEDQYLATTFGAMNGYSFNGISSAHDVVNGELKSFQAQYIEADPNSVTEALKRTKSLYEHLGPKFVSVDDIPELTEYPKLTAAPIMNTLNFLNSIRNFVYGRRVDSRSEFEVMTRYANGDDSYWYKTSQYSKYENWDNLNLTFRSPNRQNCAQYVKGVSVYAYLSCHVRKYLTRGGIRNQGSCACGQIVKIADMEKVPGVETIDQGTPQPYFRVTIPGSTLKSMFINLLSGSPAGYQDSVYQGGEYYAVCSIPGFIFVGSFSDDLFY